MNHYQISDEDIDGVVRYLQIYHPERANREYARALLVHIQAGVQITLHELAQNPEKFETFVTAFEKTKQDDA